MKTPISIVLLAGLVTCLCLYSPPLAAQQSKAQMYLVGCDVVNPSMTPKYYEIVKEQVRLFDKYKWPFAWSVYAANDYSYYYLIPVNDYADIGNFYTALAEFAGRAGTEWTSLYARFAGVVQSTTFFVLTQTPELSHIPASPGLKTGEGNFAILDAWYATIGKEEEFESHMKDLVALMKKHNITDRWDALVAGVGAEQGLYEFVAHDTSMVDFWIRNEKMWNALGKEGSTLFAQLQSCTRKREWKFEWYQPELSFTPKEKRQPK